MFPRHARTGALQSRVLHASVAVLVAAAVLLVPPGASSAAGVSTPAAGTGSGSPPDAARSAAQRAAGTAAPGRSTAGRARRPSAAGRAAAIDSGVALLQGAAPGAPAATRVGGKTYVAFGDSYSSGPGLTPAREPGCGRSAANWASEVATTFGLGPERGGAWADYSCAGTTARASAAGGEAPSSGGITLLDQIGWADRDRALGPGTEAVTFTAGGNDPWAGRAHDTLYDVLEACVRAGAPCGPARRVGPLGQLLPEVVAGLLPADLVQLIGSPLAGAPEAGRWLAPSDVTAARMTARLRPAVAAIRAGAPRASIAVVGYPRVVPPAGSTGCAGPIGLGWGLEPGEVAYLDALLVAYDRAQRAAVAELDRTAAPVRFVDLRGPSAGHDLCSGPDAWVNAPILAGLGFGGDSLHPSVEGMDEIAGVVESFARAMGLPRSRR